MLDKIWSIRGYDSVDVVEFNELVDLSIYQKEFNDVLDAGDHPCDPDDYDDYFICEGSHEHKTWLKNIRERQKFLLDKYGGGLTADNRPCYGIKTFIGWLIKEKGAKLINCSQLVVQIF